MGSGRDGPNTHFLHQATHPFSIHKKTDISEMFPDHATPHKGMSRIQAIDGVHDLELPNFSIQLIQLGLQGLVFVF
jgi:hypothetical protein